MKHQVTKIHPDDNVLVALADLEAGAVVQYNGTAITLPMPVPAKHKFVMDAMQPGDAIKMYGVLVGQVRTPIVKGGAITVSNVKHAAEAFEVGARKLDWKQPDVSKF